MSSMPVSDQAIRGGEDITADVQRISDSGTPTRITTATTTTLFAGRGVLKRLFVPTALAGIATVYDNTAGSGTVILTLPIGFVGPVAIGADCATGCTVVTAGADQVIAVHSK